MTEVTGGDGREGGEEGEGKILVNTWVDQSELTQEVLADLRNAPNTSVPVNIHARKPLSL